MYPYWGSKSTIKKFNSDYDKSEDYKYKFNRVPFTRKFKVNALSEE